MSKPVKNLITATYKKKFGGIDGAVVIGVRGLKSNDNNKLRAGLAGKKVRITVVKNSLAKVAFSGTALEKVTELLEGSSALVYGGDSVVTVAREVIAQLKTLEIVEIKGAIMDGLLFKGKEVEALSKYPTRAEAQAQVVQIIISPASSLASAIGGPGGSVASLIEEIEKKLEKGEAIAKVA